MSEKKTKQDEELGQSLILVLGVGALGYFVIARYPWLPAGLALGALLGVLGAEGGAGREELARIARYSAVGAAGCALLFWAIVAWSPDAYPAFERAWSGGREWGWGALWGYAWLILWPFVAATLAALAGAVAYRRAKRLPAGVSAGRGERLAASSSLPPMPGESPSRPERRLSVPGPRAPADERSSQRRRVPPPGAPPPRTPDRDG